MDNYPIEWTKPTEGKTDYKMALDMAFMLLEVLAAFAGLVALFSAKFDRSVAFFAVSIYFRLQHRI